MADDFLASAELFSDLAVILLFFLDEFEVDVVFVFFITVDGPPLEAATCATASFFSLLIVCCCELIATVSAVVLRAVQGVLATTSDATVFEAGQPTARCCAGSVSFLGLGGT